MDCLNYDILKFAGRRTPEPLDEIPLILSTLHFPSRP